MADTTDSRLPSPTPEQRQVAAGQFERANQVLATDNQNHDYAVQLLLNCCKLDPANLLYRQALRQTQRARYGNRGRGSPFALLTTSPARLRLKAARRLCDPVKALEAAEEILTRSPWDLGAQGAIAAVFEEMGLLEHAIWALEQARQANKQNAAVNRSLARLCEKNGDFKRALYLWGLVRKVAPQDLEAHQKLKDLAATETIARGRYQSALRGDSTEARDTPLEPRARDGATAKLESPSRTTPPPEPSGPEQGPSREEMRLLAQIKAEPTHPDGYLKLAALYRRMDELDQARAVLAQGLVPTGHNFELASELADLDVEPFRENLGMVEARLEEEPNDEELRRVRIRLLKEINTRELHLHRLKAERYPTDAAHRFELGLRLLRGGQVDEAIVEFQTTRADPRFHWRSLVYLGYCFKNRNNWRLAQRNFRDALDHLPAGEEAMRKELLFLLARGAAEAGELPRALELGEELANLDFSYRDIGRLLDEWQARKAQG